MEARSEVNLKVEQRGGKQSTQLIKIEFVQLFAQITDCANGWVNK